MKEFGFDMTNLSPFANRALPLYTKYKALKYNALHSWKQTTREGRILPAEINYARLTMVDSEEGIVPLISFTPIILPVDDIDQIHELTRYAQFFVSLRKLDDELEAAVISIHSPGDKKSYAFERYVEVDVLVMKIMVLYTHFLCGFNPPALFDICILELKAAIAHWHLLSDKRDLITSYHRRAVKHLDKNGIPRAYL